MVGKDIVAASLSNLTGNFKSSSVQKQSNVSGDFSKTMNEVQENQAKSSANTKSDSDVSKGMKKLADSDKPALDKADRLEVKPEVKEAMKAAEAVDKTEVESVESENAVVLASGQILTPQLLEQGLGELEEKITELVTEIMDVTEKELMDMLEESGMQLLDLLNPDNLKQFVLDANGCEDAISLITNEDVAKQFSQLLDALEGMELEPELGITKEELVSILEEQKVQPEGELKNETATEQLDDKQAEANVAEHATKIIVEKDTDSELSKDSAENGSLSKESRFELNQESANDANPVDLFVQNLAGKATDNVNQASAEQIQVMREIVDQIVEQIKIAIKPESTSMELQLNPESLGRVDLTVVSKNGVLTASFTAENQIAKEAIESQMQVLKDNLNNQGVKVEAIEVNVSQFGFRQNTESGSDAQGQSRQQKKTGTRRINLDSFNEEAADVAEEEVLAAKVLRDNGGTVDFTA